MLSANEAIALKKASNFSNYISWKLYDRKRAIFLINTRRIIYEFY
ncbi:hypothetical protein NSP_3900 [Nodularia spumigena CCY9414]|nr:hypothetical protein NSP_3900 [Nodularia spumigena CCY9414]